jgi:hypothetical protein
MRGLSFCAIGPSIEATPPFPKVHPEICILLFIRSLVIKNNALFRTMPVHKIIIALFEFWIERQIKFITGIGLMKMRHLQINKRALNQCLPPSHHIYHFIFLVANSSIL